MVEYVFEVCKSCIWGVLVFQSIGLVHSYVPSKSMLAFLAGEFFYGEYWNAVNFWCQRCFLTELENETISDD